MLFWSTCSGGVADAKAWVKNESVLSVYKSIFNPRTTNYDYSKNYPYIVVPLRLTKTKCCR